MTYQMLLQTIRKQLQDQEIENATFESHELLCHCTGLTKAQLFQDLQLPVPSELEQKVGTLLRRRLKEEPLAYLLGEWDFYGHTLEITPDVLIPRFDTEVLALRGIQMTSQLGGEVLDLCAGSGCVGIAIAHSAAEAHVVLGEISPKARKICRKNVVNHKLEQRVEVKELDVFSPPTVEELGTFHVIVSNPPYINSKDMERLPLTVKNFEPHLALAGGEDGFDFYRSIISQWKQFLKPGGHLIMEVGIYQSEMVETLLENEGFQVMKHSLDSQNIIRVVEGKRADETQFRYTNCKQAEEEELEDISGLL